MKSENRSRDPEKDHVKDASTSLAHNGKQTWKTRRAFPVDVEKLREMSIKDKIYYLALCGYRIEVEERSGSEYLYAIRYIERKKKRIYIGKHEED